MRVASSGLDTKARRVRTGPRRGEVPPGRPALSCMTVTNAAARTIAACVPTNPILQRTTCPLGSANKHSSRPLLIPAIPCRELLPGRCFRNLMSWKNGATSIATRRNIAHSTSLRTRHYTFQQNRSAPTRPPRRMQTVTSPVCVLQGSHERSVQTSLDSEAYREATFQSPTQQAGDPKTQSRESARNRRTEFIRPGPPRCAAFSKAQPSRKRSGDVRNRSVSKSHPSGS